MENKGKVERGYIPALQVDNVKGGMNASPTVLHYSSSNSLMRASNTGRLRWIMSGLTQ